MLRILWVGLLLAAVGAHKHVPLKDVNAKYESMMNILKDLADLNTVMQETFGAKILTDGYISKSKSEYLPTPSTAAPVSSSTTCATEDCKSHSASTESSSQGYPPRSTESSSQGYPPRSTESSSQGYPPRSTESSSQGYPRSTESSTQEHSIHVGSIKGIPGVHFPDYKDIPLTSFQCSEHVPGFYADMDTGCQVFHVCWPHRRETFLCPIGTTFNQALRACDYWYSSNCSLASHYYDVSAHDLHPEDSESKEGVNMDSMVASLINVLKEKPTEQFKSSSNVDFSKSDYVLSFLSKFLPIKAKVVVYPETTESRSKIVASASVGSKSAVSSARDPGKNYHGKHYHKQPSTATPLYTSEDTSTSAPQHSTQQPAAKHEKPRSSPSYTSEATTTSTPQYSTEPTEIKNLTMVETLKFVCEKLIAGLKNISKETKERLEDTNRRTPELPAPEFVPTKKPLPPTHQTPESVPTKEDTTTSTPGYSTQPTEIENDSTVEILKMLCEKLLAVIIKISQEAEETLEDVDRRTSQPVPTKKPLPPARPAPQPVPTKKPLPPARPAPQPVPTKKPYPLTQLNPRFIVKPVMLKHKSGKSSSSSSPRVKQFSSEAKHAVNKIPKIHIDKVLQKAKLSISPLTKKALTSNYIRLLKMMKG